MKAQISGLIGVMAALAVACKSDPTDDGVGTPTAVIGSISTLTINQGDSTTFVAQIVDNHLTPVPGTITFTSCNPAVVGVHVDPTYDPVPATSARFFIVAAGLQKVCAIASSGGVKPDTVTVTVLPVTFPGTFSKTSFGPSDTVVVSGTPDFQFDAATFGLSYPTVLEPIALPVVSLTSNAATFLGGKFTSAGPGVAAWSISGVDVVYAGVTVSLPVATALTSTTSAFSGDSLPATAPDISGWITALPVDSTQVAALVFPQTVNPNSGLCAEGTGPCSFIRFTLAAATTLTFSADWDGDNGGNPDVDIYICSGNATSITGGCASGANGGGGGAASNKPEKIAKHTFAAGTYYFVSEYYAACDGSSCPDAAGAVNNLELLVTKQ